MQYRVALLALAALALPACVDDAADPVHACDAVPTDYWLELRVDGLSEAPTTLFAVEHEGKTATLLLTPTQPNGFAEQTLDEERWLTIAVVGDNIRVFIQGPDGQVGPDKAVITIIAGEQRSRTELTPVYRPAAVGMVECSALAPTVGTLTLAP